MASFSAALYHVNQHLEKCLPEKIIFKVCEQVGHEWRERELNPALTIQSFLLQLLAGVAMRGLRRVAGLTVSAQAICAAKKRLPLKLFLKLINYTLPEGASAASMYKGLATYIVDGMSFMTPDTPELARKYGKAKNHKGTSKGYPTPKLLTLMQAGGGFISKVIMLPQARQEFTCLSRLFNAIASGLLLGDRGLVSFAHLALLLARGLHGCFQLPRGLVVHNRGKGLRRRKKKLGKQDMLVTWAATNRPKWLSKKRWADICQQPLTLRQISFRVTRKGYRTRWAWIITTLLDPKLYPAQELIELYSQRWEIEVHFRDLKQTLGMSKISAKTTSGARKEVLAFVLLYNLIRQVMHEAAQRQGVPPDRISFTDAMLWLLHSAPDTPLPDLVVNPRRTRNTQPRRVKHARHRFPQLNQPRNKLCTPACAVKI